MLLHGKGFFIWKVQGCENGDIAAIVSLARQANLSHTLIKIADGTYSYNVEIGGRDLVVPIVQALHAAGILVYGWHYLYGDDPIGEANKAIQRIHQTGVDGYVMDVEKEYKDAGKKKAAATFMSRLRAALPNLPVGLSSYRFPSYHPQVPWKEFLEQCDFNMPQVYWQGAHNPADHLRRSVSEFQALTPYRPIIPTGSAYQTLGWKATPEDVTHFLQASQSLNLSAANFWEWAHCRKYLPEVWQAIQDYSWPTTPQQADIALQYIAALNAHDLGAILDLYTPGAVHVNAARTVQGIEAIRTWYQTLLSQLLPDATFILSTYNGSGANRHLTWTAASSSGEVQDGSDTLILADGKIAYHYTYFTIQSKPRQAVR